VEVFSSRENNRIPKIRRQHDLHMFIKWMKFADAVISLSREIHVQNLNTNVKQRSNFDKQKICDLNCHTLKAKWKSTKNQRFPWKWMSQDMTLVVKARTRKS